MDQSCHTSGDSSTTTSSSSNNNNRDQYLRHLNKISHKISKPTTTIRPPPPPPVDHPHQNIPQPPPPPPPQQQNQPPVYNIKKSDFRDVVQKLTGSPAHDHCFSSSAAAAPPPIQPPKPPSSRLQRIRPPPLPQITNLPPPLMNTSTPASTNQRQAAPFSPLPPFPSVHAAAESPISAYMRYLHSTVDTDPKRDSPLVTQPQPQPPPPPSPPMSSASVAQSPFVFPSSPLPFGCSLSPRSPHPLLFSPSTAGQLGFQNFPVPEP